MIITADSLIRIKEKVKRVMASRDVPDMGGQLTQYASQEYDYMMEPKVVSQISDEHIRKIIDPLLEINDYLPYNSLRKKRTSLEMELEKAEKFADKMMAVPKTAEDSGCRGNCTGLCEQSCASGCTGCVSCSGECSGECNKNCADGCSGGCGGCSGGCSGECTHTCGSGCISSVRA